METKKILDKETAKARYSLSDHGIKQIVKQKPELTVKFGRRRLFRAAAMDAFFGVENT